MLNKYEATITESYAKKVTVFASDEEEAEEMIADMEENGGIGWDRAEDFVEWEVYNIDKVEDKDTERKVKKWARDMVMAAVIIDANWVLKEMTELQCCAWFEKIQLSGVAVPEGAERYDLWNAVLEERKR